MSTIHLKRVYDAPASGDGVRVLVDRLWPRGLKRADAHIDLWAKEAAPSDGLRRWFGHDPRRWAEFQERYRAELGADPEKLARLREMLKERREVTLLFAAKDIEHCHAQLLREVLGER